MLSLFKQQKIPFLKRRVPSIIIIPVLAMASTVVILFSIEANFDNSGSFQPTIMHIARRPKKPMPFEKLVRPKPAPVSMAKLKTQGCVADGILSEYTPDQEAYLNLINRSHCYYLHRAVETWLTPPDFETIDYNIARLTQKNVVYGMFLAEAIKINANYVSSEDNHSFDFGKMCQDGSVNAWGPHSCKPDFGSGEYRRYLSYITHRAIDLGIQSFTFGQIYYQEGEGKKYVADVVKDIRAYGKKQKINVIVGAQTGKITDPVFISLFDYIEGGTGIDEAGNLPEGPCLERWGGCWPLLWHPNYSQHAKNVLIALDWSGIKSDDLDIFARMDKPTRSVTLKNLYNYFTSRGMAFLMPFSGALDRANGGCRGPKKGFYSPDNKYSCGDEETINSILSGH